MRESRRISLRAVSDVVVAGVTHPWQLVVPQQRKLVVSPCLSKTEKHQGIISETIHKGHKNYIASLHLP